MLNTSSGRVSGVQEDALMTAGALIEGQHYCIYPMVFIVVPVFLLLGLRSD